jgi:hypothetical protein
LGTGGSETELASLSDPLQPIGIVLVTGVSPTVHGSGIQAAWRISEVAGQIELLERLHFVDCGAPTQKILFRQSFAAPPQAAIASPLEESECFRVIPREGWAAKVLDSN